MGVGTASLAAGLGVFGAAYARSPLLGQAALDVLGRPWVPYIGAVVAIVVALLGLWWLLVQGRTDTVGHLRLESESTQGITDIPASAVRDVLEDTVNRYPYVQRARARLTGSPRAPRVLLDVTLDTDADATSVWQRIRTGEMVRLRESLELDTVPTVVRMAMSAPSKGRGRQLR